MLKANSVCPDQPAQLSRLIRDYAICQQYLRYKKKLYLLYQMNSVFNFIQSILYVVDVLFFMVNTVKSKLDNDMLLSSHHAEFDVELTGLAACKTISQSTSLSHKLARSLGHPTLHRWCSG